MQDIKIKKTVNILLAEDEKDFCDLLFIYLKDLGFNKTTICRDGNSALNYLSEYKYDLLITDIGMPGISGLQVIKDIRKRGIKIPIIVITVIRDDRIIKELTELNVEKILSKPFDLDLFIKSIKAVLKM